MHTELIFYDYEFNVIGRVNRAADIYSKELYNGIGSFEATVDISEPTAEKLLERSYTVVQWDSQFMIVTSVQANENEGTLKIYGRTPNWLLSRRACPNFGHRTGTPFQLAHALVEEVWEGVIAVGPGRDLEAEETTFWRNVYNPLNEVIADCLDRIGAGHRVVYDTELRQWRFETFAGEKRKLIFSTDRRNAADCVFSHSVLDYFNGGFYTTDENNETWIEIPSDKEGIYKWTVRLDGSGKSSAESDLKKRREENKIDFSAIGVLRDRDYRLGDMVYAAHGFAGRRISHEMRITAVERWAGSGGFGERPLLENI